VALASSKQWTQKTASLILLAAS